MKLSINPTIFWLKFTKFRRVYKKKYFDKEMSKFVVVSEISFILVLGGKLGNLKIINTIYIFWSGLWS